MKIDVIFVDCDDDEINNKNDRDNGNDNAKGCKYI